MLRNSTFIWTCFNSDLSPSVECCGGCVSAAQSQQTSCMLTLNSCHLANHRYTLVFTIRKLTFSHVTLYLRISKFSSSRHWKLKLHLSTSWLALLLWPWCQTFLFGKRHWPYITRWNLFHISNTTIPKFWIVALVHHIFSDFILCRLEDFHQVLNNS